MDDCFTKNMAKLMNETYGCIHSKYYNKEYSVCSKNMWKNIKPKLSKLELNAKEQCGESCISHDISFGFPFTKKLEENDSKIFNKTVIMFKLYPTVQIQETIYSYQFISMIAEIGGYSGLLLGISVLDISRLFENYLNFNH